MLALIRTGQNPKHRPLCYWRLRRLSKAPLWPAFSEGPRPHAKELALAQDMDVLQHLRTTHKWDSTFGTIFFCDDLFISLDCIFGMTCCLPDVFNFTVLDLFYSRGNNSFTVLWPSITSLEVSMAPSCVYIKNSCPWHCWLSIVWSQLHIPGLSSAASPSLIRIIVLKLKGQSWAWC